MKDISVTAELILYARTVNWLDKSSTILRKYQGGRHMMQIRSARESDADNIATLLSQLRHPSTPDHIRRQLERIGPDSKDFVLVASSRGAVIGVIALQIIPQFHQEPPLARIIDLCVMDGHRGRHIGRQLFQEVERIARQECCVKLEVTASNDRLGAHRFYASNGMEQTHRYFGEDLQSNYSKPLRL
jgi:ribosomal protein S18 acetylase RimI-like enzyme